jgi:hypothetical protein
MSADYPAAHSMDSTWFAVDAGGHVGVFSTGEDGHLPDSDHEDVTDELWDLLKPADPAEARAVHYQERNVTMGLFELHFQYASALTGGVMGIVGAYLRERAPQTPLHIDQLPPGLRQRCRAVLFDVRFDQCELLQPLEHVSCRFWSDFIPVYLGSDGKTVRPVPGREAEFAAWVRELRQSEPDAIKNLTFDGPTEEGQP